MGGVDPVLPTPFQDRMHGHLPALVQNTDLVRQLVDFDDTPRPVGHAVIVAAD